MKKIIFLLVAGVALAAGCTKKVGPVITRRTNEPAAPVTAAANIKPDLARGQMLFTNRCGRCHALPDPAKYTVMRWQGILSAMAPKARLNNEEKVHVTAYISENASK